MDTKIKIIIFIFVAIAILYIVNLFIIAMNKMNTKTKENFVEMKVEKFDEPTTTSESKYDIRLTILDELEKIVPDKTERTSMLNNLFSKIDYFQQFTAEELPNKIEAFVSQQKTEKFNENMEVPGSGNKPLITTDASITATDASTSTPFKPAVNTNITSSEEITKVSPEPKQKEKYDISNLSNDITKIYNELGVVKTKMNDITVAAASTAASTAASKQIETFVDGNIQMPKVISENVQVLQENMNSLINGYENIRSYATYSTLF